MTGSHNWVQICTEHDHVYRDLKLELAKVKMYLDAALSHYETTLLHLEHLEEMGSHHKNREVIPTS